GRLAGAVRADEAEDLAFVDREADVVDGLHAAEPLLDATEFEDDLALLLAAPAACATGDTRPGQAAGRGRRALEEHRPQDVGSLHDLLGRSGEANLALLHEDGLPGHRQGDVHRLLDEDDGGPGRGDGPD